MYHCESSLLKPRLSVISCMSVVYRIKGLCFQIKVWLRSLFIKLVSSFRWPINPHSKAFPLSTIWSLAVCKDGGEGLFHFIMWMTTVSSRQTEGGGVLHFRTSLSPYLIVSTQVLEFKGHKAKNVRLLVRNKEHMHEMQSFDGAPSPLCLSTFVDTDISLTW